jgi:hypothetical protein
MPPLGYGDAVAMTPRPGMMILKHETAFAVIPRPLVLIFRRLTENVRLFCSLSSKLALLESKRSGQPLRLVSCFSRPLRPVEDEERRRPHRFAVPLPFKRVPVRPHPVRYLPPLCQTSKVLRSTSRAQNKRVHYLG